MDRIARWAWENRDVGLRTVEVNRSVIAKQRFQDYREIICWVNSPNCGKSYVNIEDLELQFWSVSVKMLHQQIFWLPLIRKTLVEFFLLLLLFCANFSAARSWAKPNVRSTNLKRKEENSGLNIAHYGTTKLSARSVKFQYNGSFRT